jgi:HK97 family phage major capsid protein
MSVELREKLEKRNKALTEARSIFERAEVEKRSMNADEQRQYDAHMKDAVELREYIDNKQKLADEEKRELGVKLEQEQRAGVKTPAEELRSAAFAKMLREGREGLSSEEFRALTAGSDTQGGFIGTPQEFVKQLIVKVKDMTFLRGLATGFTTNSNEGIGAPSLDVDVDDFEWTTEIKTITEDDKLRFGKRELKPHPFKKRVLISDKMLRSEAMSSEAIVMDRCAYKAAITEEKAFMLGSGNQQPLGLFTASANGLNTDRDVSTDMLTTDFTADALKSVKYSLKAQYMTKASWLFHRDAVGKIAKLKDGEGRYIFEMAEALGAIDTLMGRPLAMSEYAPNTFTTGQYVGMFADFSWYWIVDSLSLRIKRLNELYAENSLVGFIFDKETDGAPVLSEAFARIKTA